MFQLGLGMEIGYWRWPMREPEIKRPLVANVLNAESNVQGSVVPSYSADVILPRQIRQGPRPERLIVVGASTGGTEALKDFLMMLPADAPAILISQHMPEMFTRSFASRLDGLCRIKVKEAEHGEMVRSGCAYISPGHSHLMLGFSGGHFICELSRGEPVNRHRPSVDVLFRSAANQAGSSAIGVILTGMGKDGAIGMREMKEAGAYNFAQDEASCVVFGMPKEAIANGAVDEVLPLKQIAPRIMQWLSLHGGRANSTRAGL